MKPELVNSKWLTRSTLLATPLLFASWSATAADPVALSIKRLSLETTHTVAMAAITACRKEGFPVTATVVDRDGTIQSQLRDTLAAPLSLKISQMKAYTAANFNVITSQMGERANTPVGRAEGVMMSAGGVPIQAGGQLLGAVGVSGAPSGAVDEKCAQAGVAAVQEALELDL